MPDLSPDPGPADAAAEELISRFAAGDDSALGELVDREKPRILRRIEARIPTEYRKRIGASDIVQLTAMELITLRHRFESLGPAAFRAYLDRVSEFNLQRALERERAVKRSVKKEASPARMPNLDHLDGGQSTPSKAAQRREGAESLQRAFQELSMTDQEILILVDYEDVSFAEAAKALGIEEGAARRRHSRAVERLRVTIRRLGLQDELGPSGDRR